MGIRGVLVKAENMGPWGSFSSVEEQLFDLSTVLSKMDGHGRGLVSI